MFLEAQDPAEAEFGLIWAPPLSQKLMWGAYQGPEWSCQGPGGSCEGPGGVLGSPGDFQRQSQSFGRPGPRTEPGATLTVCPQPSEAQMAFPPDVEVENKRR